MVNISFPDQTITRSKVSQLWWYHDRTRPFFQHFFFFQFLVWEISTGRCIKTIDTGDIVRSVAWCPNAKISLIAVASGQRLILLNPKVGDKMLVKKTDEILIEAPKIDALGKDFEIFMKCRFSAVMWHSGLKCGWYTLMSKNS